MEQIRAYNFDTRELEEIRISELPTGFFRSRLQRELVEDGREVVLCALRPFGSRRLPTNCRETFLMLSEIFGEVYPNTADEWENGFGRDVYPYVEIGFWCNFGIAFRALLNKIKPPQEEKADYFRVAFAAFHYGFDVALEIVQPRHISNKTAQDIIDFLNRGAKDRD